VDWLEIERNLSGAGPTTNCSLLKKDIVLSVKNGLIGQNVLLVVKMI
jgi:hypothetical protein